MATESIGLAIFVSLTALAVVGLISWGYGNMQGFGQGYDKADAFYRSQMRQMEARHKQEMESMARKPLTEAQLAECKEAGGYVCPRCGDDESIDAGEVAWDEAEDDGPSET